MNFTMCESHKKNQINKGKRIKMMSKIKKRYLRLKSFLKQLENKVVIQ